MKGQIPDSPWLEISLDAIAANANFLRKSGTTSPTRLIAVVKDDAYGLGAIPVAKHLHECGVDFFAVARFDEAMALRNHGIHDPVLILGDVHSKHLYECSTQNFRISINDTATLKLLENLSFSIIVHCHIDTGMNRIGISPTEANHVATFLTSHKNIHLEGIYTHFASADNTDFTQSEQQIKIFTSILEIFSIKHLHASLIHASNTAATLRHALPICNAIRCGIGLYGCNPDPYQPWDTALQPTIALRAPVVKIRAVPKNTPVSYGATYSTTNDTHLATIGIGYAHGIPRNLSNNFNILQSDTFYPIVGRVTMDYIIIDIGNSSGISVGDTATLIGCDTTNVIRVDDMARSAKTIGYEILCGLSPYLNRHYTINNKEISVRYGKDFFHG